MISVILSKITVADNINSETMRNFHRERILQTRLIVAEAELTGCAPATGLCGQISVSKYPVASESSGTDAALALGDVDHSESVKIRKGSR